MVIKYRREKEHMTVGSRGVTTSLMPSILNELELKSLRPSLIHLHEYDKQNMFVRNYVDQPHLSA